MLEQILMASFGLLAVWCLSHGTSKVRRYGYLAGLLSQPFWYHAAIENRLWGQLLLSFCYTAIYIHGFYRYWLSTVPARNERSPGKEF